MRLVVNPSDKSQQTSVESGHEIPAYCKAAAGRTVQMAAIDLLPAGRSTPEFDPSNRRPFLRAMSVQCAGGRHALGDDLTYCPTAGRQVYTGIETDDVERQ